MNLISELYTLFIDKAMSFLTEHWQLFIIAVGLIFVSGGVRGTRGHGPGLARVRGRPARV